MTNCKYKLRKLSVGLVSVGTMLIAPTVLGQEVNASTETSASSTTSTASTAETSTPTGTSGTAASGASGEATVATANGGPQSAPATSEATPQPQAQAAPAASAPTTVTSSSSSDSDAKTPKAASTTSSSATVASPSNGSNKEANAETAPQMMDVEQYKIKDENSSITVADKAKQLKIRRDDNPKDKDLFDVKREVKDNGDGTLDVTLKVMPKQIDEGADVMALLDVSQKMTKENFDKAKEQIKKWLQL
ncbi:YSIRK-type signal peptide-containing protein [Streptococcus pyogenes]